MDPETTYHHGDLRRALLNAAEEIIGSSGAAGLTMRGVSRSANVSHAAPYHHFKDKDSLLAAVAEEGFQALQVAVEERSAAAPIPARALQEGAIAYVLFAVQRPGLFRVMFGPQLADKKAYPSLKAASASAFSAIERGLAKPDATKNADSKSEVNVAAASAWALVHGLAMLLIDDQFHCKTVADVERFAREVTSVYWKGLSGFSHA